MKYILKQHLEELADSVENSPSNNPITLRNWSAGKYFKLMNDIDDSVRTVIGMYSGGYEPYTEAFQGDFDGNNKKITLAIDIKGNKQNRHVALFSHIISCWLVDDIPPSHIHHLIVDGYVIYDNDVRHGFTGGIVGYNDFGAEISYCINRSNVTSSNICTGGITGHNEGTISHCYNFGNIIHTGNSDMAAIGGIAGHSAYCKFITYSHNSGNIISATSFVGGIVGLLDYGNEISYCINIGTVKGGSIVGGIIGGYNSSSDIDNMYNCINSGLIVGKHIVGGIIGRNKGAVKNCINTNTVKGNTKVGCIVGENDGGTIENCHYDKQICSGEK